VSKAPTTNSGSVQNGGAAGTSSGLVLAKASVAATIVIAIATVCYSAFSIRLEKATRDSVAVTRSAFEAANRPYVGVGETSIFKDEAKEVLYIKIEVKNFGTVPASHVLTSWNAYIDGAAQPQNKVPHRPVILFPQDSAYLQATAGDAMYSSIVSGRSVLTIVVEISYKGVTDRIYRSEQEYRYAHDLHAFMNIGGTFD
jgi:hypothetical protein